MTSHLCYSTLEEMQHTSFQKVWRIVLWFYNDQLNSPLMGNQPNQLKSGAQPLNREDKSFWLNSFAHFLQYGYNCKIKLVINQAGRGEVDPSWGVTNYTLDYQT